MNSELWSLTIAALALLGSIWTIVYTRSQASSARGQLEAAREQVEVARQAQREQSEPYVIVDIQPQTTGSSLMVLVIENIGPTMARNVKIGVSPDLVSTQGGEVNQMLARVLSRTIPMIPPGRRLEYLFDLAYERFGSDFPMVFDFTVASEGPSGPVEELRYTVDLGILAESLVGERPTKKIEEKIDKLTAALRAFARHYEEANQQSILETRARRREQVVRQLREPRQQQASSNGE